MSQNPLPPTVINRHHLETHSPLSVMTSYVNDPQFGSKFSFVKKMRDEDFRYALLRVPTVLSSFTSSFIICHFYTPSWHALIQLLFRKFCSKLFRRHVCEIVRLHNCAPAVTWHYVTKLKWAKGKEKKLQILVISSLRSSST